jgi:hypothetical protein
MWRGEEKSRRGGEKSVNEAGREEKEGEDEKGGGGGREQRNPNLNLRYYQQSSFMVSNDYY